MTRISLPHKKDTKAVFGEGGRAKIVAVAAVVAGVVVFAGVVFVLATGDDSADGDEGPDEFMEEGFDQPFVGSDEDIDDDFGDDDFLYDDEDEQEVADEDSDDTGPFEEFNREEYSAVLNETLQEYEPEDYEEAISEFERQIRRATMALTPERRREVALNHDQHEMEEIILEALRDYNPEAYEMTQEQFRVRNE